MKEIIKLVTYLGLANILAWYQIQGQFLEGKIGKLLNNDFVVIVIGIPIGWLLWKAAALSYTVFGGVWNIRMIGFGLGTMIFGIMTWGILGELPAWHTTVSIILAIAIILLQFSNITMRT